MRRARLLCAVGYPTLVDQIGMDIVHIFFTDQVIEPFHTRRGQDAVQNDLVERGVQLGTKPAKIGC